MICMWIKDPFWLRTTQLVCRWWWRTLTAQHVELKLRHCQQITNGGGGGFVIKSTFRHGMYFFSPLDTVNFKGRWIVFFFSMTVRIISEEWATSATGETIYGILSSHWKGGFCIGRISAAALPSKILHMMRNTCCEKAASSEAVQPQAFDWRGARISPLISNICTTQWDKENEIIFSLTQKSTNDSTGGLISQSVKPTGQ